MEKSHRPRRSAPPPAPEAKSPAPAGLSNADAQDEVRKGGSLPYLDVLEDTFGQDLSGVRAEYGKQGELDAIGAHAMATDDTVTFADSRPDLDTVVEEAAHVIQFQKHGFDLAASSQPGDRAEQSADEAVRAVHEGRPVKDAGAPTGVMAADWLGGVIGGVAGSVFGPLGAAVGAVAGSAIEDMITGEQTTTKTADPGFVKATEGDVKAEDFPEQIKLPEEYVEAMDETWEDSFPDGKSKEQGGILVTNPDGSYEWKRGEKSTSGSFSPNWGDVDSDEKARVLHHTHPYDASEGGHTDVSFSRGDLANLVNQDVPLKTVKSGDAVFAVGKSKEFNDRVAGLDEAGKKALSDEMKATYAEALKNAKGSFQERIDAAVKATCQKYQLPYYKGSGDTLNRVDTSK